MANRRFHPSDEQKYSVGLMAAIGIPHHSIALAIGINLSTLKKYFQPELSTGKIKTIAKVADSLVRQALAGNMTAAIFFLKTQAGWKETSVVELNGSLKTVTDTMTVEEASEAYAATLGAVAGGQTSH